MPDDSQERIHPKPPAAPDAGPGDKQDMRNDWITLISALLLTAALMLVVFASATNAFGEWYRTHVYVRLQGSIGRLTGAIPFSVAELICIILPVITIYDLFDILHNSVHRRDSNPSKKYSSQDSRRFLNIHIGHETGMRLTRFFKRLMLLAALLFFLYEACCGVNYHSESFVPGEIYESSSFTVDQLAEFCEHTAIELQSIYEEPNHDSAARAESDPGETAATDPGAIEATNPAEMASTSPKATSADSPEETAAGSPDTNAQSSSGGNSSYPGWSGIAAGAVSAMDALGKEYPQLRGYYPRPKKLTILSRVFSMMGVSGIYCPFTIEANVNGEMEDMEKPFTACHELSHLRGYMNEGEANYIGWLACIGSDDRSFNRSGWLIAWIYAGSSLRRTDPDLYYAIRAQVPEAALEEIKANDEFWSKHENKASDVQSRINDVYLKSNGVDEGIASYGQLTTLMLYWYFTRGNGHMQKRPAP